MMLEELEEWKITLEKGNGPFSIFINTNFHLRESKKLHRQATDMYTNRSPAKHALIHERQNQEIILEEM